jgi:hypothetical protein
MVSIYHPVDSQHQHGPAAYVSKLISVPPNFPRPSKAKLKNSGDKESLCFRSFWIGKLSDVFTYTDVSVCFI